MEGSDELADDGGGIAVSMNLMIRTGNRIEAALKVLLEWKGREAWLHAQQVVSGGKVAKFGALRRHAADRVR